MMYRLLLTLPIPSRDVGGNGRAHWATKAKLVKSYRNAAHYLTVNKFAESGLKGQNVRPTGYLMRWFYRGVTPDIDNCLSRCKAYLDGIAQALECDDREWQCVGLDSAVCGAAGPRVEITMFFEEA